MEDSSSSDREHFSDEDNKIDAEETPSPKSEVDLTLDNADIKTRYRACMILSGVGTFQLWNNFLKEMLLVIKTEFGRFVIIKDFTYSLFSFAFMVIISTQELTK